MNSYPIGWRRMESRMKNWRSLHYYTENILYVHFILLNWKYVHNVFIILPNFQSLFKVSLLLFSLFAKGEVKNLSKVDWTSLFSQNVFKVIQTLVLNKAQSLFISALLGCHFVAKDWNSSQQYSNFLMSPVGILPFLLLSSSSDEHPLSSLSLSWFSCFLNSSRSFFVTHIQTEKISSWNGPTVHVWCFMLARASSKTFVSRIHIR